jgi:hypothetical protein
MITSFVYLSEMPACTDKLVISASFHFSMGENKMKKCIGILFVVFLCAQMVLAAEKDNSNEPWEKAGFSLGVFLVNFNSNLDLGFSGSGITVSIDGEEVLGLEEDINVLRANAFWQIARRHRVDFSFYDLSRDGKSFLGIELPDGEGGTIDIGTRTETEFDLTFLKAAYGFSFFKNEHFDLAITGGIYATDVKFELEAEGEGKVEDSEYIIPLPVVGLRGNFALTPKWFIKQNLDVFYLTIGEYTGSLIDLTVALEYNFWKYAGVGVGYNLVSMNVDKDDDDAFLQEIDMSYDGLLLYGKVFF